MVEPSILIVDDTPVNLKLTKMVLTGQGFKVSTAKTAEEALGLLDNARPDLILADIQLPGMDGLEMTRRIKADARKSDIPVVALTAYAMSGDRDKAIEAGCDGYISKPIDTRSLGTQIREILAKQPSPPAPADLTSEPAPPPGLILTTPELANLRDRFLQEGIVKCQDLLKSLDSGFPKEEVGKYLHQLIGGTGILGYADIAKRAREMEGMLRQQTPAISQLRAGLSELALSLHELLETANPRPPEHLSEALAGKRIALVGFAADVADRACQALHRAGARPLLFSASEVPDSESVGLCSVVIVQVARETRESCWLNPQTPNPSGPLFLLASSREELAELAPDLQTRAADHLVEGWGTDELTMRVGLALLRKSLSPAAATNATKPSTNPQSRVSRPEVLIADDDPLVMSVVHTVLQNYGMSCNRAGNGRLALQMIQETKPQVAVLDVNMPEMSGYEVLSAVRAAELPVRVIMLTARQREEDILRGFKLGADDYMVKPFNTLELVARLKRLLER